MVAFLQPFEPPHRLGLDSAHACGLRRFRKAFRHGFKLLRVEPNQATRFARVQFQRGLVGMEQPHSPCAKRTSAAAKILIGVDLAQQPRRKAVARYPPDLWNRHSAPVASGTLEKQSLSLPNCVQLRSTIRARWHEPKLAGIPRLIQSASCN